MTKKTDVNAGYGKVFHAYMHEQMLRAGERKNGFPYLIVDMSADDCRKMLKLLKKLKTKTIWTWEKKNKKFYKV